MTDRAYTVSEIDALREACANKWLWGSYRGPQGSYSDEPSRVYYGQEKDVAVEQMVRTHMMAGHTAQDLYASDANGLRGGPASLFNLAQQ